MTGPGEDWIRRHPSGWSDDVAVLPPDPWDWPDARALGLDTPVPGNPDREPRDPLAPDYDCGRELC